MRLITLLAFAFVIAWADTNADLLSAARAGDLAAVKTAVEGGAVLETKTPYGQTPLYLAAMNGHEEVVPLSARQGSPHRCQRHLLQGPHARVCPPAKTLGRGEDAGR
jgi:hypothetical protein